MKTIKNISSTKHLARRKGAVAFTMKTATGKKVGVVLTPNSGSNYTHHDSNDSEVVARYLDSFRYDPARKTEVLSRYDSLLAGHSCTG